MNRICKNTALVSKTRAVRIQPHYLLLYTEYGRKLITLFLTDCRLLVQNMPFQQLILIPGLLCDETVFTPLIASLPDGVRAFVPELTEQTTISHMAEEVLARAESRFSLLGFSMGGRVALECMRLAPERVEKLALLDTGVHPARSGEEQKRQVLVDLAYQQGMEALAKQWLPPMIAAANRRNSELVTTLTTMVCRQTPEIHQNQIQALLTRPDAGLELSKIRCPTLLAVGEQDQWSPVSQHEEMAADIDDAHLSVIREAGHFALLENPDEVNKAVLRWLSG